MIIAICSVALSLLPSVPAFETWWRELLGTHSHHALSLWGSYIVVLASYFPLGLAFLAMELSDRPAALRAAKIQAGVRVTAAQLRRLGVNLLVNFGPIMLLQSAFIASLTVDGRGLRVAPALPSPVEVLTTLAALGALHEPVFYYTHRLLHYGPLYRHVHKVHHEFHAPIALAAT